MKLLVLVDRSLQMEAIFSKEIEAVTARARALGAKVIPVVPRKEGTWGYRPEGETTGWAPLDEHPDLRAGGPARLVLVTDGMSDSILGKSLASYLGMMAPGTLLFILHPWSGTEWRRSRLGRLLPGHYASRERRKRPGAVVPILDLSVSGLDAAWRRKSVRGVEFSVTLEEDDSELERLSTRRKNSDHLDRSGISKSDRRVCGQ